MSRDIIKFDEIDEHGPQDYRGTFKIDVHEDIANDNHAVVLSTDTAQRGDKSLRVEAVAVYHIDNGQVTEAWFFNSDAYADDEFFS